ncbi:MAG TPA: aminotransferase class I/II-fold pyridoxal phosphate-dependent enzyme [Solirubrobacteraceae bacterium]
MSGGPAPDLFARLPEQYFTRIVAAAAAARGRPGPRLIDLGRGNPDLPPPAVALDALRAALEDAGGMHGYPPFQGRPELTAAIAERYRLDSGVALDPETEIAVVPGTKTGIMLVAMACAGAGDAIALPDPGYPDYLSAVALVDARAVALPLDAQTGWQPELEALAGQSVALVVLNYPSNPCAACEAPGTFEAAVAWAHEHGAWLLHDLAYRFLAFDGARARSVLEVDGARDVAVELWSPSKIYGMAGWRVGFVVGNAEVVGRVRRLVDHLIAGVPVALQHGLVAALTGDQSHVAERFEVYRRRRELLVSRLGVPAPEGTFYAWWPLPDGLTVESLLAEHRVAVAPGEGFGARGAGHARLSLAVDDDDLEEGVARLAAALDG